MKEWGKFAGFMALLVTVNFLGMKWYTKWDLTGDKRFSLTPATKKLLRNLDSDIYLRILLDIDDPPGFKRLRNALEETILEFQSYTPYLEYEFVNPNEGSTDEINQRRKVLAKDHIYPMSLFIRSGSERKEVQIYPWVLVNKGKDRIPVNIIENNPGFNQEENLNNSIGQLEYKLAKAIRQLTTQTKKNIVFLQGHGEFGKKKLMSLRYRLKDSYNTSFLHLDSTGMVPRKIEAIIIAKPLNAFSEKHKFALDQFVMHGGKLIWLIDKLGMDLDSLKGRDFFVPLARDLNIDDQLFKYGVRIKDNLVLDLECSRIPQVIGQAGGKPQIELFPWYYHVLATPAQNHPATKNIDRVNLYFPSSIDTIKTKFPIRKTVLLHSSGHSRFVMSPTRVGFDILRYEPKPEKFNRPNQALAVMLEGVFPSLYDGRVSPDMQAGLKQIGRTFLPRTENPNKMLVVADADFIKAVTNRKSGKVHDLGYNLWERNVFQGNRQFILNVIDYMLDDSGILRARGKELKLRLLDRVRTKSERLKWQLVNVLLPVLIVFVIGFIMRYYRRRRYAGT